MSTEPAPPSDHEKARRALGICSLIALAALAWVARPVGVGIFIGALIAFTLQPLYAYLPRRTRRVWAAQLICLLIATAVVSLIVVGISAILITRGSVLGGQVIDALGPTGRLRADLALFDRKMAPFGINVSKLIDELRDAATSVATYLASVATTVAGKTFHALLTLFFMLLTTHFVLARGAALERFTEDVSPLAPEHTRLLVAEMRKVGRATLLGSVVTGLAQGVFAAIIFAVVGLPEAIFFGVATAVASLLPGVGTLLVWVPAGIYLIATGHPVRGAIELGASTLLVIGFADYALRPRLVGDESMPTLLTFMALFGGVEAFGLIGLLLGPLIVALAVAVLRLYRAEVQFPRTTTPRAVSAKT